MLVSIYVRVPEVSLDDIRALVCDFYVLSYMYINASNLPLQHGTGGLGTARRYDTSAMQGRLETSCTKRLALHLLSGSQGRKRLPAACVIPVPSKGDGELGKFIVGYCPAPFVLL